MRTFVVLAVVLACAVCFAAPSAYCSDSMLKKLGRGVANCVTFPLEIPQQMSKANASDGPVAGGTWGVIKGVGMAGVRALVGVYEVATFPLPFPEFYKPILTSPEFFFEDWDYVNSYQDSLSR